MVDYNAFCDGFPLHIFMYESCFSCDRYVYYYECSDHAYFSLCSNRKDARHCSEDLLFSCIIGNYHVFCFFSRMRSKYYVSLEEFWLVGYHRVKCSRNRGSLLYPCTDYWSSMGSSYLGYMVVLGPDAYIDFSTLVNLCGLSYVAHRDIWS